uniref:Uncharacterized protein n=1 Tax=Chromera velia CCMP2878 TaxID=1169474 RepID=A0A0G4HLZ1_9ALVE|eukprot:Cvel_28928.t1-p1 / transcript=Cvel_28928.t1 / gene=Cvel_28928 / organism=Chromera_velia_CCMP2878 / gene_product=hypothetical protein / transcript_product=hypothetical protein / location=Cvel_scaffold3873:10723-11448(+) / protein_length=242 / sequence_SO=supercontig / SO=protein_coding / is_pseudo=false
MDVAHITPFPQRFNRKPTTEDIEQIVGLNADRESICVYFDSLFFGKEAELVAARPMQWDDVRGYGVSLSRGTTYGSPQSQSTETDEFSVRNVLICQILLSDQPPIPVIQLEPDGAGIFQWSAFPQSFFKIPCESVGVWSETFCLWETGLYGVLEADGQQLCTIPFEPICEPHGDWACRLPLSSPPVLPKFQFFLFDVEHAEAEALRKAPCFVRPQFLLPSFRAASLPHSHFVPPTGDVTGKC